MLAARTFVAPIGRQSYRIAPRAAGTLSFHNQRFFASQSDRVAKFNGVKDSNVRAHPPTLPNLAVESWPRRGGKQNIHSIAMTFNMR
ncbi:hypothetical protein SODALDRAFT_167669 [Sodiomyces alkalinus F11]|uniref:Uncharacterized protein n=1 Tax=Sodiomyces alkalinus (strain CBS 110278 / VKM F-3762 / F11) TaxID=1314773 RepID=A0A3N2PVX3_SODAK|nr:hypothetical protein SODALDRAFT_167669 [Sodiomyces alkalinus F11]ROT38649.1 hypothetical protein SODALDRAFT_167669 [Sodiomyces alkalinus F11]